MNPTVPRGVTPEGYPTELARARLSELGVKTAAELRHVEHGTRVWVGGIVTHRQRPATAGGTTFVNLEDETGLVNVICSKGVWARYRRVARGAGALLVRGILERMEPTPVPLPEGVASLRRPTGAGPSERPNVINIIADRIDLLVLEVTPGRSRDFH